MHPQGKLAGSLPVADQFHHSKSMTPGSAITRTAASKEVNEVC